MRSRSLGSASMRYSGFVRPERSRRTLVRRSCQPTDPVPITSDQRLFLRACASLDATLECERFIPCRSRLAPDELDRPPSAGPVAAYPLLVLPEAAFKVFGVTDVIGSVATAENIDPELHVRSAFALRLRSGRTTVEALHRSMQPPRAPHIPRPQRRGSPRTRGYALPRCSAAEALARHCRRPPPSAVRGYGDRSRMRGCPSSS